MSAVPEMYRRGWEHSEKEARRQSNGIAVPQNRDSPARNTLSAGCITKAGAFRRMMRKAAKWYRRAAEQGHAIAQNALGFAYRKGERAFAG